MDEKLPFVSIENDDSKVNISHDSLQEIDEIKSEKASEPEDISDKNGQIIYECVKEIEKVEESTHNTNLVFSKSCPWIISNINEIALDGIENSELKENKEKNIDKIRTTDVKPNPDATFDSFDINPNILIALNESKWYWPSPIQEATILQIMNGKNVIARSKNGTGKTGAYAISVLNTIDSKKNIQVIILIPTRELALQIGNVCFSLSKYLDDVNVMVSTGGTNLAEDIYRLSRPIHILIGTPGRILDLLIHKSNLFSDIKTLILDEADKLLSLDFQLIIEDIIKRLSNNCQKVLFSATYPLNLKSFIKKHFQNCEYCNVMNELALKGVTQYYAYLKENQKTSCLQVLIRKLEIQQAIIFCNSAKRVELLAKFITETGYSSYYIHSKMNQEVRNRVFHDFRSGFVMFLVCTDIISRGIDISNVNVVFNFDFPRFNETYLHRIGRCGRFGRLGIAINLVTDKDKDRFKQFENEIDTKIYAIPKTIDRRLYVYSCQTLDQFNSIINT